MAYSDSFDFDPLEYFPDDMIAHLPEEDQQEIRDYYGDWFETGEWKFLDDLNDILMDYEVPLEDFWAEVYGPNSE